MVRAGRHYNRITVTDNVFLFAIKDELGLAFFYPKELIDVPVNFVSDFLFGLQTHHHKLAMLACK
jgi:hypothetical protein